MRADTLIETVSRLAGSPMLGLKVGRWQKWQAGARCRRPTGGHRLACPPHDVGGPVPRIK